MACTPTITKDSFNLTSHICPVYGMSSPSVQDTQLKYPALKMTHTNMQASPLTLAFMERSMQTPNLLRKTKHAENDETICRLNFEEDYNREPCDILNQAIMESVDSVLSQSPLGPRPQVYGSSCSETECESDLDTTLGPRPACIGEERAATRNICQASSRTSITHSWSKVNLKRISHSMRKVQKQIRSRVSLKTIAAL